MIIEIILNYEIFIDLLEYIDYLCDMEDEVLKVVYRLKKIDKYKQIFGSSSVVNILLKGVKNSLDYSGYLNYGDIKSRYYNLSQKIKNFIQYIWIENFFWGEAITMFDLLKFIQKMESVK